MNKLNATCLCGIEIDHTHPAVVMSYEEFELEINKVNKITPNLCESCQ